MKRLAIFLIGMILAFSLTGFSFAQEKANPGKSAKAAKKGAAKIGESRAGGLVTALDVAGKKITIKQDKVKTERTLTLKVSQQVDLAGIKVGDEVNVWFTGNTVTTLIKVF
jgi:Cu/Ag efflux protein CusF